MVADGKANYIDVPIQDLLFVERHLHQLDFSAPLGRDADIAWHPMTQAALQLTPGWNGEAPQALHFYTDGSATRRALSAAAACVLLVQTESGLKFGGAYPFVLPATSRAYDAEHMALLGALLWSCYILATTPDVQSPVAIYLNFDCVSAGFIAAGIWCSHNDNLWARATRSLWRYVQERFGTTPQAQHVRGHSGHPWNEAADAAAKAALDEAIPASPAQHFIDLLTLDGTAPHLLDWLSYLVAAQAGKTGLPPVQDRCFRYDLDGPFHRPPSARCLVPTLAARVTQLSQSWQHFALRIATANVLTLYPKASQTGMYISARQQALLRQCAQLDLHIIGVQETRSKWSGHRQCLGYHLLSSPSTAQGHGGVQLWIKQSWQGADSQLKIEHHHLKILTADPRILVVHLRHPSIDLILMSLHAPNNVEEEDWLAWWRKCTRAIPKHLTDKAKIVCVDANSKVGSLQSLSVGDFGAEEENLAGRCFHQWLCEQQLVLPQTFPGISHGPATTWMHSSGSESRLDYVALDSRLANATEEACRSQLDLSISSVDHFAVQLQLRLGLRGDGHAPHREQPVPTPREAPTVSWSCDVHTHAHEVQLWLDSTRAHPQRSARRKHHLSEETWACVQLKKCHWNRVCAARRAKWKGSLRALFQAWRGACDIDTDTDDVLTFSSATPWLKRCDFTIAVHLYGFALQSARALQGVREDDRRFYQHLADHSSDESLPTLWKKLKGVLPKPRTKRLRNLRCIGPETDELFQHFDDTHRSQREAALDSRRREKDAHWWLEEFGAALLQGRRVIGIAMDTAVSAVDGNLLSGPGRKCLAEFIEAGAFAGNLSGPPCETWSQARHNEVPGRRGPVPLRSASRPWGLCGLTGRNLEQLKVGNALMLRNLENEVTIVLAGGISMMEHPEEPDDPQRASIWRTNLHQMLMAAPDACQAHIAQSDFGAATKKPTIIRGLQAPGLHQGLQAWRILGRQKPTAMLGGWDAAQKSWRTARAKEYPIGLSRALTFCLLDAIHHRIDRKGVRQVKLSSLSTEAQDWFNRISQHSRVYGSDFLPDYQPSR
eukprot:Skav210628  [mRNA]  locus=scaffold1063:41778:47899:+ [translate_table: standard]